MKLPRFFEAIRNLRNEKPAPVKHESTPESSAVQFPAVIERELKGRMNTSERMTKATKLYNDEMDTAHLPQFVTVEVRDKGVVRFNGDLMGWVIKIGYQFDQYEAQAFIYPISDTPMKVEDVSIKSYGIFPDPTSAALAVVHGIYAG